jgi:hypothetical protein
VLRLFRSVRFYGSSNQRRHELLKKFNVDDNREGTLGREMGRFTTLLTGDVKRKC